MNRKTIWAIAFLTISNLGQLTMSEELKVGQKAPEFSLKGTDGKLYKLSQFKDKQYVIVAWYPKALTGG